MTNRFKGLDLIDRVPKELWMEVRDFVQKAEIKTIPKEKKCEKANGCLRRPYTWLRKQEKTTRTFRYELSQIPYAYILEVTK